MKRDSQFTDEARTIVRRLDSYTQGSSSGTGSHVITEGDHSDERRHRGDLSEADHLEVYDESRYFVLTGDVYDGHISIENRSSVVRAVLEDFLPKTRHPPLRASRSP